MMKQLFELASRSHRLPLMLIIAGTLWLGLLGGFNTSKPVYSAPTDPEVFGALSGRVTDVQGEPLPGITVELYELYTHDADYVAQTDANGNYRIGVIVTGIYVVRFFDPAGHYTTQYYPAAADRSQASKVSISGHAITGIDDTLQVAGQISGMITMMGGLALQLSEIELYQLTPEAQYMGQQTLTHGEQHFRFGGLHSGRYAVCVRSQTTYPNPYKFHECYADHLADNGAVQTDPIAVTAGTTISNINFVFGDYTNLVAMDGIVMANSGERLAGVTVKVWRRVPEGWLADRDAASAVDGTFQVAHLTPGLYALGFTDWTGTYVFEQQQLKLYHQNVITINLPLGGHRPVVTARLVPGAQITGIVTLQDEAFANGYATLYAHDDEFSHYSVAISPIDPLTGKYVLKGIPSGTYQLYADGYRGIARFAGYYHTGPAMEVTNLVVQPSEIKRNMNFALVNDQDPYQGSITGTITANQAPLPGIQVQLYHRMVDGLAPFAFTFTDAQGKYRLDGLPNDSYFMRFFDPQLRYATIYYPNQRVVLDERTFSIFGTTIYTNINAELMVGGIIEGHVYKFTGEPLPYITIVPYWREDEQWIGAFELETQVDKTGYYQLPALVPDTYHLGFLGVPYGLRNEYYDNASNIETATDIVVRAGTVTQADAIINAAEVTYLPLLQR